MKKKFRSNFSKQNNKIQNCKRFSIDFLLNNISTILKVIYQMNVVLEFSGGAELLVGRVRQHKVVTEKSYVILEKLHYLFYRLI